MQTSFACCTRIIFREKLSESNAACHPARQKTESAARRNPDVN